MHVFPDEPNGLALRAKKMSAEQPSKNMSKKKRSPPFPVPDNILGIGAAEGRGLGNKGERSGVPSGTAETNPRQRGQPGRYQRERAGVRGNKSLG